MSHVALEGIGGSFLADLASLLVEFDFTSSAIDEQAPGALQRSAWAGMAFEASNSRTSWPRGRELECLPNKKKKNLAVNQILCD